MNKDSPLPDIVHGRVEDEIEPRVVVLSDVMDSQEDRMTTSVVSALASRLQVALDVDLQCAAALSFDHVGVKCVRHLATARHVERIKVKGILK